MPFEWNNPVGYLFAFSFQCIAELVLLTSATFDIIFAVEAFTMLISLAKDLSAELNSMKKINKRVSARIVLAKKFNEIVQFHSNAKQLSNCFKFRYLIALISINLTCSSLCRLVQHFSDLTEYIITVIFLWSTSTICGTLLMIQIEIVAYYSFKSIQFH